MTTRPQPTPRDDVDAMRDRCHFRLPMSLNEFMKDQMCTDSASNSGDQDSVSALRRYIDSLKFDDVDSTISDMLNTMSLSSEPSLVRPLTKDSRNTAVNEPKESRLDLSQWSEPFSHHHHHHHSNAEDPPNFDLKGDVLPRYPPQEPSPFMFTTYYDSPQRLSIDDLSIHKTPSPDKLTWDTMWSSPALKRYIRPRVSKVQPLSPCFLSESLRAIKEEVVRTEKALARVMDQSAFIPDANERGPPYITTNMAMNATKPSRGNNDRSNMPIVYRRTSLCRYWQRGGCKRLDCNFAHGAKELMSTVGVWKTTICHHWRSGMCRVGNNCRHAHGEAERQPKNIPVNVPNRKLMNLILRQDGMNQKRVDPPFTVEPDDSSQRTPDYSEQRMRNFRQSPCVNVPCRGS